MNIELMSYNIQYGVGQDWQYNLDRTAAVIRGTDIVCLQEVTTSWPICNHDNQPEILAAKTNRYFVYAPGFETDAGTRLADGTIRNARRGFGNMILSRWPIVYSRSHSLPRPPVDIPPELFPAVDFPRVALEAVIDIDGQFIRVISLHLSHLPGGQRDSQIDVLRKLVTALPAEAALWGDDPRILAWSDGAAAPTVPLSTMIMGDYNVSPDDPALTGLQAPLDGQAGCLVDGWQAAKNRGADDMTCRGGDGKLLRIDYMFVTPELSGSVVSAKVDQSITASDHFPLYFEINL